MIVTAALLTSAMPGCAGYQIGTGSLYRPDIRTVHVPIIESDSYRRNLGERLTEAVVKQIELKTPYKVVDNANADTVLTARIVGDSKRVIAETATDEPRDIEVNFNVQVSWVDRRGDLISGPVGLPVCPELYHISQSANLVPEAGQSIATAQQEAIQRLAEQIVAQMEMPW